MLLNLPQGQGRQVLQIHFISHYELDEVTELMRHLPLEIHTMVVVEEKRCRSETHPLQEYEIL